MGKKEIFIRKTGEPGVEQSFPVEISLWNSQPHTPRAKRRKMVSKLPSSLLKRRGEGENRWAGVKKPLLPMRNTSIRPLAPKH